MYIHTYIHIYMFALSDFIRNMQIEVTKEEEKYF